jgi:3-hydroxyacyl-CoA dehydrogenase
MHLQGLRHADFVIEAVVEDEEIKRNIFQTLDKVRSSHSSKYMFSSSG